MATPSPHGTSQSSSVTELDAELKQRAEALFPYLKLLAAFDGYTMTSWLDSVRKHVHPESYVYQCEDNTLIMLLTHELIAACAGATPGQRIEQLFNDAIAKMEVPTAKDLSKPEELRWHTFLGNPPDPDYLRSTGLTQSDYDESAQWIREIFKNAWNFCHIRFQQQWETNIPQILKCAIWAARKIIFSARYAERERLCAIKKNILHEMQSATPGIQCAFGRTLTLGETMAPDDPLLHSMKKK